MVSLCLPSDALFQYPPSYLGFSYLGGGVSLHGCFSKAQPLLLTLDEGYLLTAASPDLECGMAPLGTHGPVQPRLLGRGVAPPGRHPWPWVGVAPLGCSSPSQPGTPGFCPWPRTWGSSSRLRSVNVLTCLPIQVRSKRHGFDSCVWKILWRRSQQPTPVFLLGGSFGQRSLAGCSPCGHTELNTTEVT